MKINRTIPAVRFRGITARRGIGSVNALTRDQLRSMAGMAYSQMAGKAEKLAQPIGRTDRRIRQFRAGESSPLSELLEHVYAWERDGQDTTPLLAALKTVQQVARQDRTACLRAASELEESTNHAANLAQLRVHAAECPVSLRELAERMMEQATASMRVSALARSRLMEVKR